MTAAPEMMILFKILSVYLTWTISDYYIPLIWEEGNKGLQSGMEQASMRSCFVKFQRETFLTFGLELIMINHQLSFSLERF